MKKLFLVALCSMPLLSVARGEEGKMKSGDSMQQGDATKQGDAMNAGDDMGHGSSMEPDSTKTSVERSEHAKKTDESKAQNDGRGGSMQHEDQRTRARCSDVRGRTRCAVPYSRGAPARRWANLVLPAITRVGAR